MVCSRHRPKVIALVDGCPAQAVCSCLLAINLLNSPLWNRFIWDMCLCLTRKKECSFEFLIFSWSGCLCRVPSHQGKQEKVILFFPDGETWCKFAKNVNKNSGNFTWPKKKVTSSLGRWAFILCYYHCPLFTMMIWMGHFFPKIFSNCTKIGTNNLHLFTTNTFQRDLSTNT